MNEQELFNRLGELDNAQALAMLLEMCLQADKLTDNATDAEQLATLQEMLEHVEG